MALLKKHFRPTYDAPSTRLPTQVQKMVDAPRNFRRVHPFIEKLLTYADPSRYFLKINISETINRKQETLELCALMFRHVGLNPRIQLGGNRRRRASQPFSSAFRISKRAASDFAGFLLFDVTSILRPRDARNSFTIRLCQHAITRENFVIGPRPQAASRCGEGRVPSPLPALVSILLLLLLPYVSGTCDIWQPLHGVAQIVGR